MCEYRSRKRGEVICGKPQEDHVDFIETQLELIPRIGIENYIQLQSGPAGSAQ